MENEIKIMDGLAKIKRCKSSNVWQFSIWIKKEKKYYSATTGTRNKEQAIEFAQTETAKLIYRSEAEKEKGVNWANAGRLFVFPIGIWATYENSNQAIAAANQREVYLTGIKQRKGCK